MALEEQGGQHGHPDQVVHGAQLVRGEAQVLRNGPVLGAAGHVEGAAVRRRLEKELVCAGQVIGPAVPEQALPAEHRGDLLSAFRALFYPPVIQAPGVVVGLIAAPAQVALQHLDALPGVLGGEHQTP